MRLPHHPELVSGLREPTASDPWRVLISGCMAGLPVAVDGTSYGMGIEDGSWLYSPKIRLVPTCPEHLGIGTPRTMPDLHDGDGFDVLDGKARVLDEHGTDLTAKMLARARARSVRDSSWGAGTGGGY